MRRLLLLTTLVPLAALTGCGSTPVTRARLERDLPRTFSNLYVQQAALLGHRGITVGSLHARAQCDKGGPKVPDHGPGADWICQMTWNDPTLPAGSMPGKFEMNVHANACYTAGGPSKIVGLQTITDKHGATVDNPVFEFDGCLNPHASDAPTGVTVATTTAAPTTPAELNLPRGPLALVRGRGIVVPLHCSAGAGGCAGTLTVMAAGSRVGQATYAVAAGREADVAVPTARTFHPGTVRLRADAVIGGAASAIEAAVHAG